MALVSSTQPSLRARLLPRFPAQVIAGNGMVITKQGSVYTFATTGDVATLGNLPDINTDKILGRDSAGIGPPEELTLGGGLGFTGAGGLQLTANQRIRALAFQFYKAGAALAASDKVDFFSPISGSISRVTLLADQTGSVVVDIWKAPYASYPPTVANTITAAALPTISSGIKYQDAILTGWTTTLTAGDCLRFNLNSAATITRLTVCLDVVTV